MQLAVLDFHEPQFPDPNAALDDPDGLLAVGGNLQSDTLLSAYYEGIFPWYNEDDPLLWWSPSIRCVIDPQKIHISKSLQKQRRKKAHRVTFNQSFSQVIKACAQRDHKTDTWINNEMILAYTELNRLGKAHSVEVWQDDKLVGGAYGVAVGAVFCGESMFSYHTNASKLALVYLCEHIVELGFKLIDCQLVSDHLMSMGAESIERNLFLQQLKQYRDCGIDWHNNYLPVVKDK